MGRSSSLPSQDMDIYIWCCSDQKVKWVTVSNSLSRSPNPRSIGSISSMIGQAKVIMMCKCIDVPSQKYNTSYDIRSCDSKLKLEI